MSVVATRLDGQNIGLRLDGLSFTVSVVSVNLTTGTVTSPYCSAADLQNLRAGALTLFQLVPLAERSTVTFLSRLVAVATADNTTLTLSASVVGGVATLVATVGATPANLVVHLPYAPDGLLAWAATSSGGGGGGTVTAVTASAPLASSGGATPNISLPGYRTYPAPNTGSFAVGNLLTLSPTGVLAKANASTGVYQSITGVAVEADVRVDPLVMTLQGAPAEVLFVAPPSPGDVGRTVYLSTTAGRASMSPPSTPGTRVYQVGLLASSTLGPNGGYPVAYQPQYVLDL